MRKALALVLMTGCTLGCDQSIEEILIGTTGPDEVLSEQPAPTPTPSPTPEPLPTPEATPSPTPQPDCAVNEITCNTNDVAKVTARVYFLELTPGVPEPGSANATVAPVGSRIHYDCTPRDSQHKPTLAKGVPYWTWSPADLITGADSVDYTPAPYAIATGLLEATCRVDGITSNVVRIRIQ